MASDGLHQDPCNPVLPQVQELYTVEPASGTVDPNKEAVVHVVFNKARELRREVEVVNSADIMLATIEPLTSNKVRWGSAAGLCHGTLPPQPPALHSQAPSWDTRPWFAQAPVPVFLTLSCGVEGEPLVTCGRLRPRRPHCRRR